MRRGRDRERGATLVEVGLVLPMLLILAIGLSEIGFLVIDYVTVTNAARGGARTGSAAATTTGADNIILNVVEEAACNLKFSNLVSVTIYKAQADGSKPANVNLINKYNNPGSLSALQCANPAHGLTPAPGCCPWTPASRDRIPPDFDTLGVEVVFSHSSVTGLFPFPTINWTERAIMQVEPDTSGSL
jgi:hypothetical protein